MPFSPIISWLIQTRRGIGKEVGLYKTNENKYIRYILICIHIQHTQQQDGLASYTIKGLVSQVLYLLTSRNRAKPVWNNTRPACYHLVTILLYCILLYSILLYSRLVLLPRRLYSPVSSGNRIGNPNSFRSGNSFFLQGQRVDIFPFLFNISFHGIHEVQVISLVVHTIWWPIISDG